MARAVLLMKNTSLSVEEIAAILGYGDQSSFYKAFKSYSHVSPRKYNSK